MVQDGRICCIPHMSRCALFVDTAAASDVTTWPIDASAHCQGGSDYHGKKRKYWDFVQAHCPESIPPRRSSEASLRVLQWNLHNFWNVWGTAQDPSLVARFACSSDADVMVFQECGSQPHDLYQEGTQAQVFADRISEAGYRLMPVGVCEPHITVLATRNALVVERQEQVPLDDAFYGMGEYRAAYARLVLAGSEDRICVYGIHLNHRGDKGPKRLAQVNRVLTHYSCPVESTCPALIVGDFNQQRRADYSPEDWDRICCSNAERGQPEDDGVNARLQEVGFECCLDNESCGHNWTTRHPTLTHWSCTVVDYAYSRGMTARGTYILSTPFSDHLPVVTDWLKTSGLPN